MKSRLRCVKAVLGIIMGLSITPANSSGAATIFTSIEESKCFTPPSAVLAQYGARGLNVQECKGIKGWRVFIVITNERSWIDLKHADRIWTSEDEVVQENSWGHFPNVGGSDVEWSTTTEGHPSSIIFRIDAQGMGKDGVMDTNTSRYFALKLKQNGPAFCGVAKTKEKARALATSGKCDKELKSLVIPKKTAAKK